ncbi:MAG: hypothetical protein HC906_16070 [Bacteroidales bacterium]|nr:hypothetical protein [Bacteroidales bacterium]
MIFKDGKDAFLFDSPMTDSLTMELVKFIKDSMLLNVVGFVPNHWHSDCMGGISVIKEHGIKTFANQMTIETAKAKGLIPPDEGFNDSIAINLNNKEIHLITWVPDTVLIILWYGFLQKRCYFPVAW